MLVVPVRLPDGSRIMLKENLSKINGVTATFLDLAALLYDLAKGRATYGGHTEGNGVVDFSTEEL